MTPTPQPSFSFCWKPVLVTKEKHHTGINTIPFFTPLLVGWWCVQYSKISTRMKMHEWLLLLLQCWWFWWDWSWNIEHVSLLKLLLARAQETKPLFNHSYPLPTKMKLRATASASTAWQNDEVYTPGLSLGLVGSWGGAHRGMIDSQDFGSPASYY
jgi:hypothetical protein